MTRAAIYARISSDDGTALGVTRQVADCRKLAADLGWEVAEEYVDNDVSASTGKRRPAYQAMLADLAKGRRDAVIVYHVDRLTRRPIELEEFIEVATKAGISHVRFVSGGAMDVTNGDGLLMLRMLAAVAAAESATKSRRITRKLEEVAADGRPHGGQRGYGYDKDGVTVRPDEAKVLRDVVARYLAGESMRSIATWLDEQGVKTITGKPWSTTTLRSVISGPRIAGLRRHRGEVIGRAVWPAIITEAERDKVLARMAEAANTGRRTPRRYLLSGLCRCAKCGHKLYSSSRIDTRRYVCIAGPDHRGCGRLTVVATPLEELITDAVLYRLDTPELAAALTGRADNDNEAAALSDALASDREQLDDLAAIYAEKRIKVREWMAARGPIEERINDTERRLSRLTRTETLTGLPGHGKELRARWAEMNLTRQAAIIGAVLDHVVIAAGSPRANQFDPTRAEPVWKL